MKAYKVSIMEPCGIDGCSTEEFFFLDKEKAEEKFKVLIKNALNSKYFDIFNAKKERIKYHFSNEDRICGCFRYYYHINLSDPNDVSFMKWFNIDNMFFKNFMAEVNKEECVEFLKKIGNSNYTDGMLMIDIQIKEITLEE